MKKVIIYTDGGCWGNPGPGAWAALLEYNGIKKLISGFEKETTNNRMELKAVIEGLKVLKYPVEVEVYTDSKYIYNGINEWIKTWIKNNWKTSNKKEVKNKDLWEELLKLVEKHKVKWFWVKGHNNIEGNEICDKEVQKVIKENIKSIKEK